MENKMSRFDKRNMLPKPLVDRDDYDNPNSRSILYEVVMTADKVRLGWIEWLLAGDGDVADHWYKQHTGTEHGDITCVYARVEP
jgi:hypothetical protein